MARSFSVSAPVSQTTSVTWNEFIELEDDDRRELIDGVLVQVEVPGRRHEKVVVGLVAPLVSWARANDAGEAFASGYKVRITDRRGVMPDVQFISKEKIPLLDEKGLSRGAPDLVVEVISPSSQRYDRVIKLGWYAAVGVREYWLVDPIARTLERLVLGAEGKFSIADSLADDAIFEPGSFPGLSIPLADLWVEAG